MRTIFCPNCATLILDASACPACGWARTAAAEASSELWRTGLNLSLGRSPSAPAVAGDSYCLAAEDGTLVALSTADGTLRWQRRLSEHATPADLSVAGGLLLVSLLDTRTIPAGDQPLIALSPASGTEAWRSDLGAHSISAVAGDDGRIYCTTSDNRLHALEQTNGRVIWSVPIGAWGPAAPGVGADLVIAGGREATLVACDTGTGAARWRVAGAGWFAGAIGVAEGLAVTLDWSGTLYAIRLADGSPAWSMRGERGRGFSSPPLVADGQVFIGDRIMHDGQPGYALRAFEVSAGRELWRHLTEHHIAQMPARADSSILCVSGERLLAIDNNSGALRWAAALGSPAATGPVVAEHRVILTLTSQHVVALSWRSPRDLAAPDPAALLAGGNRAGAAAAYALSGDLARAAELYAELGHAKEAAQLYERCGQAGQAAALWAAAGDLQRAGRLYQEAGDQRGLAEVLERQGQPLQAARAFEAAGEAARAATLYQEAGELQRAAELYEGAGRLAEALALRRDLGHWERAADLAERIGEYDRAAEAYERLGRGESAAMAYERAAQQLATRADGGAQAADRYERAARLYSAQGDVERATLCQREVLRCRELPDLVVIGRAQDAFIERSWNVFDVQIENTGFGPARNISIAVGGPFESSGVAPLQVLAMQRRATIRMALQARPNQFGPAVPLELNIGYEDSAGRRYEEHEQIFISVIQAGHAPQPDAPVEIKLRSSHTQPPPGPPAAAFQDLSLTVRFTPQGDGRYQVLWDSSLGNTYSSSFTSPFRGHDLLLVVRALDYLQAPTQALGAADLARLADLGLPIIDNQIEPLAHRTVGRTILRALMADPDARRMINTVRDMARANDQPVVVRLRFPPDAVELAALPWELLWGEGDAPLLLDRGQLIGCTRHLDLDAAIPPPRQRQGPLRILAVAPEAGVSRELRDSERAGRQRALAGLHQAGAVAMKDMEAPVTIRRLYDQIQDYQPDVIHIVGHGRYVNGYGALILDKDDGGKEVVSAERVAQLFSGARMVLLHACQSAMVGEAGLLTGVGPAISAAGVPAVVAMQLTVRVGAALRFAEVLYRTLAHGEPLQRAMSRARQALFVEESDAASWYVPTLTITSRESGPFYL